MTRLSNDPRQFGDDALAGFVAANPRYVQAVHGGVVRAGTSPDGQVAVVLGGGSGHYPAFAGWVGPGMAHAAACGNIFSSPSASQVYSVARAADNGGGVILGFGNYAGDILHFGQTADRLRGEGVDVRIVTATDDIASNTVEKYLDRRGIAGYLPIFKVMGAAAAEGMSLDRVEEISRRVNERTRSLGVAFAGCTLPGAEHPLFTVPEGKMAIGLGIHGEPSIETRPLGTAVDVADLLVDGVLGEAPERGQGGYDGRIAVLLNGLGGAKYEELFVVYKRVAERLAAAGLDVVEPEVGEHITSLDMAGLSLTVTFLDEELERLWTAPVDAPALRRGLVEEKFTPRVLLDSTVQEQIPQSSPESRELAAAATAALTRVAAVVAHNEEHLGDLDAVAGDGDHGQAMVLGSAAALHSAQQKLADGAGVRTVLVHAGDAWSEGAGGTSGALWGAALSAAGRALHDDDGATPADVVAAVRSGTDAILRLGGADCGDKTMVDALVPFIDHLEQAFARGDSLPRAWAAAARSSAQAAQDTAHLVARRGRARTHGETSRGTPDPGALSFSLAAAAVSEI